MQNVLGGAAMPGDIGVSVELQIPQTSKRIDVVLTGQDEGGADNAVMIERWQRIRAARGIRC